MKNLAFIDNLISYAPSRHVAWALLCCSTFSATGMAMSPDWQADVEFPAGVPCEMENGHILPAQPALGLALYRFECPGMPPRLVSATRRAEIPLLVASQSIARGSMPTGSSAGIAKVTRLNDLPLPAASLPTVQARRAIAPGEPLLARDFEPRRVWIGGESIMLKIVNGKVSASLPGVSLGVGRLGESGSAKAETGKVFSGTVALEDTGPLLIVGSKSGGK